MRLKYFMTSCRDKLYHHTISNKINFNFLIILFGKIPSRMNSMSDLASSNDVTTNGVNGRIGNKTWWKCKCCGPMETSIEGVCCLDMTEICKRRFSSRFSSCLNVCRSDPHFVLWYSRRKNFVSYLFSIQYWSLANQNKRFLHVKLRDCRFL